MKNVAIIAHYDPLGEKDNNFTRLIDSVRHFCTHVQVVSTSMSERMKLYLRQSGVALTIRENIGYDFLSFSIGFEQALTAPYADNMLFVNDSIYIDDTELFKIHLEKILVCDRLVVFSTSSRQILFHGQSFLFRINNAAYLTMSVLDFFASVRIYPNKFGIIQNTEMKFSEILKSVRIEIFDIFTDAISHDAKLNSEISGDKNPCQFYAEFILRTFGYAKYERIVKNPLKLQNSAELDRCATSEAANRASIMPVTASTIRAPCVVVCHCFYIDLVEEILDQLTHVPDGSVFCVSSSNVDILVKFKTFWRYKHVSLKIFYCENTGRDVWPFFQILKSLKIDENTPILKIHGKKSLYSEIGSDWRRNMLSDLIGSGANVKNMIGRFSQNPRLGMIGPSRSYFSRLEYWGADLEGTQSLAKAATGKVIDRDDLGFFAGTMFWIRRSCLASLEPNVQESDFPEEAGQRDGTMAHYLERAIPIIARIEGYQLLEIGSGEPLAPEFFRERLIEQY